MFGYLVSAAMAALVFIVFAYLLCVQEFSEQRFFAFISLCAD